jgi:hypothetical protein
MNLADHNHTRNDALKVIAIFSMIIDHIGLVLFPDEAIFRYIGRLAFPLFAYHVSIGIEYTSNVYRYAGRLLIFGFISQIPYTLATNTLTFNVMFTFGIAVMLIHFLKQKKYLWSLFILLIPIFIPLDYGLYGIGFPVIFWLFRQRPGLLMMMSTGWTLIFINSLVPPYQLLCLLGVALTLYPLSSIPKITLQKFFFYGFYPLHLLVLFILSL